MPLTVPDQTIASQVQVPNGMNKMASMLDMQSKALQFRKNSATYDADVAQRQAESSSAVSGATVNAANVQPLIDQQAAGTKRTQTALASDQFKLTGDYMDKANQISQGLINDPAIQSGDINAMLPKFQAAKQRMIDSGIPAATAEVQTAHLISAAVANPAGVSQLLKNSILQSQPSAQQSTTIQPTAQQTDNGQAIQTNNLNPLAAGGTGSQLIAPIQKQLPPTTPTIGTGGQPGYLGAGPQSGQVPSALSPSDAAAMPQWTAQRTSTNQAAAQVPNQHANNEQLLHLIDTPEFLNPTGTGSSFVAKVLSTVGLPAGTDYATNHQRIAHLVAMQTQQNESAMGVKTDAGRQTSEIASGGVSMGPDALKAAIKVSDATSTGLSMFNNGMEIAAKNSTKGDLGVRDFQNQWSNVYTPTAMRLYNAAKSGDQPEVQDILKQVGGNWKGPVNQSPGVKDLLRRASAIDQLSTTGHQ